MCAILGITNSNISKDKFKNILDIMSCRGYDHTGYFFDDDIMLGHKRLAIIDIENGNQPIIDNDYIIVYNGEIYNTDIIRNDLIKKGVIFKTKSDTEVILKGYIYYGDKILNILEGIYAFAIYNKKYNELFVARDKFGIKPLYYSLNNNQFIFSSMIKPILESGIVKPVLTEKEIGNILALGPSKPMGSGIFKDIYELRPAHYLVYKDNKLNINRYWNVESKECLDTFNEAKEKVRILLTDSIKRQMVSDVDIATLLSGGVDSSIITAIVASNLDKPLTTYSIDYEDNDKYFKKNSFTVSLDEYYINLMSKYFKTNHKYKIITQEDVVKLLKETLYAREYPGMTDIESSLLWFSKEIRKDYKVILSGECADEIFGGYPWFYRKDLNNVFPWINNINFRQNLLNKDLNINLGKILEKEYGRTINELNKSDQLDKYKRLFYINMTHFMTTLLDRKDRMTMFANLEARVPFADSKLIEYLWNLPFDYKYQNNTEKYLLREAFKGILPDEVLYRKKNPYPKTHHPYFLKAVTELLKERLKNPNSCLYKIFDINEINNLLNDSTDINIPWFGQLMTKPQLIAYLYQFDIWVEEYNIQIQIENNKKLYYLKEKKSK